MKKHLIALAVASAVSVPAMAQVTLGGLIDTGIGGDSITNGTTTRKTSITGIANRNSTSVITFSASEDLGGGMKASFFTNPALSTQTGLFAARDIYASLSGGFGDLRIGRFVPAFETVTGAYSQGGGTSLTAGTADFIFGSTAASLTAAAETAGTRVNYTEIGRGAAGGGALQYTSPNMSGLTMMVGVANTINDTSATVNTTGGRQTEGALNFVSGPISVGAAILNHVSTTEGTAADTDVDLFSIGASVNLDGIVLRVGHVAREEKANGAANPTVDADVTSIGVTRSNRRTANALALRADEGRRNLR